MKLNPYEELGVGRDATEAEVRRAYFAKARERHSDAGGTAEAFHRLRTAMGVLTDPVKRKTFNDTGRVEEDRPDNDRAAAMAIIEHFNAEIINAYITRGFDPADDPRRVDVPAEIARRIEAEIPQAEDGIRTGQNVVELYRDMMRRLRPKDGAEGEDFLGRQLQAQVDQAETQIANLRLGIRVRRLAIEIVRGYSFQIDSPHNWPRGPSYVDLSAFEAFRR